MLTLVLLRLLTAFTKLQKWAEPSFAPPNSFEYHSIPLPSVTSVVRFLSKPDTISALPVSRSRSQRIERVTISHTPVASTLAGHQRDVNDTYQTSPTTVIGEDDEGVDSGSLHQSSDQNGTNNKNETGVDIRSLSRRQLMDIRDQMIECAISYFEGLIHDLNTEMDCLRQAIGELNPVHPASKHLKECLEARLSRLQSHLREWEGQRDWLYDQRDGKPADPKLKFSTVLLLWSVWYGGVLFLFYKTSIFPKACHRWFLRATI
ncbi:MAG: hypothetical protein LQ338_005554 [Usnochroma carphineum]|nr:MAG: hypothetical protein LQ338_005554 [Usnochroma carphineum]